MIDINELRLLAQAATPGHWHFWRGWVAADIDNDGGVIIVERPTPSGGKYQARVDSNFKFIAAANPKAITELLDRLEAAESRSAALADALHQISLCSQNSMSSQLECGRIARDALEKVK